MMTRQLTWKEMGQLFIGLALVATIQADLTYPNHTLGNGWLLSMIFGVIYAVIGGAFGIMASSPSGR